MRDRLCNAKYLCTEQKRNNKLKLNLIKKNINHKKSEEMIKIQTKNGKQVEVELSLH